MMMLGAVTAGCGGSTSTPKFGARYIEQRLPLLYAARDGGMMRNVACVEQTTRVYRCVATVKPHAYPLARVTMEVTIDPTTGRFVTRLL